MYSIIESLEKDFQSKLTVTKLDVEQNVDLASSYNISSIPTFIFLKNDKQIEKMVGPQIKSKLMKIITSNQ